MLTLTQPQQQCMEAGGPQVVENGPGVSPPLMENAQRILVVDDHQSIRETFAKLLRRQGYVVETADCGAAALATLDESAFDLVVLDVIMPGLNGFDVLQRIRERHAISDLAVIMATGCNESDDIADALARGANDYVTKPIDFAVASARIRTQLELCQSVRRIRHLEEGLRARNLELEAANRELVAAGKRVREELEVAARVQTAFLPAAPLQLPQVSFDWSYRPCDELAGDALQFFKLSDRHVGMFVLDVSGHGVGASLMSVAAARMLSPGSGSLLMQNDHTPTPPVTVARMLDEMFPFDAPAWQFFTLFYAVLDLETRELSYVSSGHPPAIRVSATGQSEMLDQRGCAIGFGGTQRGGSITLDAGDRLCIYSDGVLETMNPSEEQFGVERIAEALAECEAAESTGHLMTRLDLWRCGAKPKDDVSVVVLRLAD